MERSKVGCWKIMTALDRITAGCRYDERLQCTVLANGSSAGTCTNAARLLQAELGGIVVGYQSEDNPRATVGQAEGGHDFLLVGEWLVDWWARDTYGLPAVLHRDRDWRAVLAGYGKVENWVTWSGGKFIPLEATQCKMRRVSLTRTATFGFEMVATSTPCSGRA